MYEIAFFNSSGSFVLPVNPAKLPIRETADHAVMDILGLGEAVRPGLRKLREYAIDFYLPPDKADEGVAFFRAMIESQEATRLIYSREQREAENVAVVLQTFDHEERGGEVGSVYCKLDLLEFRPIMSRVVS